MTWKVQVRDHAGNDITNAVVSLRLRGSQLDYPPEQDASQASSVTHEHQSPNGTYERRSGAPDPSAGGDYILIVSAPGWSTVVQPVDISGPSGTPLQVTIQPHPRLARTVSIPNKKVNAGTGGPGATFVVTLYPASEVYLIEGKHWPTSNTSPGNDSVPSHVRFRKNLLYKNYSASAAQPFIDQGTHVVVYSLGDSWMRVFVRSAGRTWLLIGEDYSINDIKQIYAHLDRVGQTAPGTVREVSFFSHAWLEGPILVNTDDNIPYSRRARDANDRDPRMKDFDPPNLSGWPNIAAAIHSHGHFRSWGCFSSPRLVGLARLVNSHGSNAPFQQVTSVSKSNHTTIERVNGPIARQIYMEYLRLYSFVARAANLLGLDVGAYGAAPGTWADYNGSAFWIPWDNPNTGDKPSFDAMKAFLTNLLGTHFQRDGSGYINYTMVEGNDIPDARPNSDYIRVRETGSSWVVYFHHSHGSTVSPASGVPTITSQRFADVSAFLFPANPGVTFPAVPSGTPGTQHTLSRGTTVIAIFVVAELFNSNNDGGLRCFQMHLLLGAMMGVARETIPYRRVRVITTSVTPGIPLRLRYWDMPRGGSVGIAEHDAGHRLASRLTPTPSQSGEMSIVTTGLGPGRYVLRCYDHGGGMLGQSSNSFTVT